MRQWQVIALASGVTLAGHAWLLTGGAPSPSSHAPPPLTLTQRIILSPPDPVVRSAQWRPQATSTPPVPQPAPVPPAAAQPMAADRTTDRTTERFWLPAEVDFRAWPRTPPDAQALDGLPWSADAPVKLRLTISAQGEVLKVDHLGHTPLPDAVLAALSDMFKATPFMPARRQGQDVASLQDIEVAWPSSAQAPAQRGSPPAP